MRTLALVVGLSILFGMAIPEMIDNLIPLSQYWFVMTGIFSAGCGSILGFVLGSDEPDGPDLVGAMALVALVTFWIATAITFTVGYLLKD